MEVRYFKDWTVYFEALQVHMLKWADNRVRRRVRPRLQYEQTNLFTHTDLYKRMQLHYQMRGA